MKGNRINQLIYLLGALLLCSSGWLVDSETALAAVIRVPADEPTIRSGVSTAQNGDTVLVADGIYTGQGNIGIRPIYKEIKLISENGPQNCVIDGQGGPGPAFYFSNDPGRSIFRGFTIRNFKPSYYTAAIHIHASSPIITDCIMENNSIAIELNRSAAQIRNCSIINSREGIRMSYSSGGTDKNFSPAISNYVRSCSARPEVSKGVGLS